LELGFSKINLLDAVDWKSTTSVQPETLDEKQFAWEKKFDISDRVIGMWRPENGGERKVVEPLFMSIMYGEDDLGPFVLVAIDHCDIEYHDLDIMRSPILAECNITSDRVIFMPSHCHVTLVYNTAKLQHLVKSAIQQAKKNMAKVDINAVNINIDGKKFVINRHIHVPGIGTRTIMFNDFCKVEKDHLDATEQVKDWVQILGANSENYLAKDKRYITHRNVDNNLQALFFRKKSTKEIVGSFVRFAAHAVIVSEKKVNGDISADYPGYLKKRIEGQLGGVSLFAQGLSGDLRPLNKEYSHVCAQSYGESLADKILSNLSNETWIPLNKIEYFAEPLNLPLRNDLPTSTKDGELNMNRIDKEYDKAEGPGQRRKLQNEFWYYYRSKEVMSYLRPDWRNQGIVTTFMNGLLLNDCAIIACPGELNHTTGIKMTKPFATTNPITVGIANEYISYIPPMDKIEEGGYEPSVRLMTPESSEIVINTAHKLLNKMYDKRD
jgi:hypothetical protein